MSTHNENDTTARDRIIATMYGQDKLGDALAVSVRVRDLNELLLEHERLTAAYEDVKTEYHEYRLDRQDQMTRVRSALEDAEKGARTGNMLTPPWVVQSIADIRAAWEKVTR